MADVYDALHRLEDAYGGEELAVLLGEEAAVRSSIAVMVSDISDRGARLSGIDLPKQDTEIWLKSDEFVLRARVAWSVGTACGIEFREPLNPQETANFERLGIEGQVSAL